MNFISDFAFWVLSLRNLWIFEPCVAWCFDARKQIFSLWKICDDADWHHGVYSIHSLPANEDAPEHTSRWARVFGCYFLWGCTGDVQWICRAFDDNFPAACILQTTRSLVLPGMGLCSSRDGAKHSGIHSWVWNLLHHQLLHHWLCPWSQQVNNNVYFIMLGKNLLLINMTFLHHSF